MFYMFSEAEGYQVVLENEVSRCQPNTQNTASMAALRLRQGDLVPRRNKVQPISFLTLALSLPT